MIYDIEDLGIQAEQFFQGCPSLDFDAAYTGIGNGPRDALEDALECAAMGGWFVETIPNDMPAGDAIRDYVEEELESELGFTPDPETIDATFETGVYDHLHYYVIVRFKIEPGDETSGICVTHPKRVQKA